MPRRKKITRNQGFMAHLIDLICLSISFANLSAPERSQTNHMTNGSRFSRQRILSGADSGGHFWASDWLRQITWLRESAPKRIRSQENPLPLNQSEPQESAPVKFLTFDTNSTSDRDIRCAKKYLDWETNEVTEYLLLGQTIKVGVLKYRNLLVQKSLRSFHYGWLQVLS